MYVIATAVCRALARRMATHHREEESTETHGHITSLAVARSHRKLGLATKLMNAARALLCVDNIITRARAPNRHRYARGVQRRLQLTARPRHQQGRTAPLHTNIGIQVRTVSDLLYDAVTLNASMHTASTTSRKSTMQTAKMLLTCANGSSLARAHARGQHSRHQPHRSARRTCSMISTMTSARRTDEHC